jgi:hypothetical protein
VRIADCDGSQSQAWQRDQDQPLEQAGRCLDIDRADGKNVRLSDCDGSKYQRWHFDERGAFVNLSNAECLQPVAENKAGILETAPCTGGVTQQFRP